MVVASSERKRTIREMKVLFRTTGNNIALAGFTVIIPTQSIMLLCSAFVAALHGIPKQILRKSTLQNWFITAEMYAVSVLAKGFFTGQGLRWSSHSRIA